MKDWFYGMTDIPIDLGDTNRNRKMLRKYRDNLTFQVVFSEQYGHALDRVGVKGLPIQMSKRVLLESLIWHCSAVFFKKEEDDNWYLLPGVPTDESNINGDPGYAEVFSLNGKFNKRVKLYIPGTDISDFLKVNGLSYGENEEPNAMILWENKQRFPYIYSVIKTSLEIADTYRTLDICRSNIKNPQVFYGEESMQKTVEKYLEMRESNASAGFISTGILEADKLKVVPFDPKGTSLSDVTALIEWYDNKAKERNGVKNNSQMDKKGENLVEAEVDVTDESTKKNSSDLVDYLNEQMEEINKFTGLNIVFEDKGGMDEDGEADDIRRDDTEGSDNISDNG